MTLERIAARLSDKILSQNREDLELALRKRIGDPHKWSFLGNGVDTSVFDRSKKNSKDAAEVRKGLGLSAKDRVIGFVGRPVKEKGLSDLYEAVQVLRDDEPSIRLLIVGSEQTSKKGSIGQGNRVEGIEDFCIFAGQRDDLPDVYGLMEIFVLPSYREGFPRAPMEAALMELPCVVTDVRGCRDVVVHGQTGFIVPPRRPQDLAQRLQQLLADEELRNRLGKAGREYALRNFDERVVFKRVLVAYAEALSTCGIRGTNTNEKT
jgi:glycosyltransferase involved in cell wall biosynthesis